MSPIIQRGVSVLLLVPLIGACRAEPDFDERYEAADKALRERAATLDGMLEASPDVQREPAAALPANPDRPQPD